MHPATIDSNLDLCAKYLLCLDRLRQCGVGSLLDTLTHVQHLELNPRPFDLESNAMSTWPHSPANCYKMESNLKHS